MDNFKQKATARANRTKAGSTIEASGYWLNTRLDDIGVIGTSLARGMRGHDNLIAVIEKYGIDKTNAYLRSIGHDGYVSKSGDAFEADSLADKMKSLED